MFRALSSPRKTASLCGLLRYLRKRSLAQHVQIPASSAEHGHAPSFLYEQKIDNALLQPDLEELNWFKAATGIYDEDILKEHICSVTAEAFAIFPYPCIRNFNFTKLKISRLASYSRVLEIPKGRPDAVLLDMGCCFGNDARRVVYDGYPSENVICTDIRPEFWELGRKLFRDDQTFKVPFLAGNIFDPAFLSLTEAQSTEEAVAWGDVKTLGDLRHGVSVIHASAFFHLFDREHQEKLAHLFGSLLSRHPGSMIFGSHSGAFTAAVRNHSGAFAHSPDSWKALWERVLGKGQCEVDARLVELLEWSVTRL